MEVHSRAGPPPSRTVTVNLQMLTGEFDNSGELIALYGPNEMPVRINARQIDFSGLPADDPHIFGRLYERSGTLMVSKG